MCEPIRGRCMRTVDTRPRRLTRESMQREPSPLPRPRSRVGSIATSLCMLSTGFRFGRMALPAAFYSCIRHLSQRQEWLQSSTDQCLTYEYAHCASPVIPVLPRPVPLSRFAVIRTSRCSTASPIQCVREASSGIDLLPTVAAYRAGCRLSERDQGRIRAQHTPEMLMHPSV